MNEKQKRLIKHYVNKSEKRLKQLKGASFVKAPFDLLRSQLPYYMQKYGSQLVRDGFYLFQIYCAYLYRGDQHRNLYGTCFLTQEQIAQLTGISRNRQNQINAFLKKVGMLEIVKVTYNGRTKNIYIPMLPELDDQKKIASLLNNEGEVWF